MTPEEQVAAVMALHTIEHRYTSTGGEEWSFRTPDEVVEFFGVHPMDVIWFDICAHCGPLEMGGYSDGKTYRDSLWPCKTVLSLGYPATTHEGEKHV